MSLMGGAVETQFANPFEFAWRLATALQAECFLFPAPLVVDSAETRERLMADRGIARLAGLASALDLAVVSAGGLADSAGSLVRQLITESEAAELLARGCVADIMCNFIDAQGQPVDHPLNRPHHVGWRRDAEGGTAQGAGQRRTRARSRRSSRWSAASAATRW